MNEAIALVDDHVLLRNGLANLLRDLRYTVVFEADNGRQLVQKLDTHPLPEVVLMDINMPVMDGFETTLWLKQNHPGVKVLALSMLDDESTIIKMIRNGANGYVLKDCDPDELQTAIEAVLQKGFYHSEMVSGKLVQALRQENEETEGEDKKTTSSNRVHLNEKETEFLKWVCTDLSYKEIADKMNVSPRTVDGYRDTLHEKLNVKSRVGMALFAVKNGLVKI
ncbi:MAG TPA: response regulator transcription factor [Flavisolibacter sp.]|nr:response regulator transcription factor [Flavisolibacter sp.]